MAVEPLHFPSQAPGGAPDQITKIFPFQSYFDASFEALTPNPGSALLAQPPNSGIIQSTLQDKNQTEAHAIGLAPWSEAPIAVQMQVGDSGGLSSPIILRPGEIIAPAGFARAEKFRNFKGLLWGLPFGWLGGGLVSVFLFKSPESMPSWYYGQKEVCFHKFRTTILASSANPPAAPRTNWPVRFPWTKAFRGVGATAINQANGPNVAVVPTKTVLRLNAVNLAAPEACRVVFWGTDTLDQGADGLTPGAPATATTSYWEFSWPTNTAGGWPAHQQMVVMPDEFSMLAANSWGVTVEALGGGALVGATVNIARFGLI
jgi:hypothetical protein